MLKLYFATHLVEAFTTQFDDLLSWAEIVAMECAYSDDAGDVEEYWNAVSDGRAIPTPCALSPMEEFRNEFLDRLMLKNKIIVFERSPFKKGDQEKVDALYDEARAFWSSGDAEKAIRKLGEYEKEFGSQSIRRDIEYSKQLRSLTTGYAGKTILCYRGVLHYETLPVLLWKEGVSFSSHIFMEPYVHPFAEEVAVRLIKGQEASDEALVLRHIEQDLIFEAGSYDYKTKMKVKDKVASMTRNDVKKYIASLRNPFPSGEQSLN